MSEFLESVCDALRGAGFVEMDTPAAVANGVGFHAKQEHAAVKSVHVWSMTPSEVPNADAPQFPERDRLHRRYQTALEAAGFRVQYVSGDAIRVRGIPESRRPYSFLTVKPPKRPRASSKKGERLP